MSLINQMLADLEARKGGTLSHVDSALDGLHPAGALRAAVSERPRLVLGSLFLLCSLAALWATREPLLAYLRAAPPAPVARRVLTPPPAPAVVTPAAPAAAPVDTAPAPAAIVVLEPAPETALEPAAFDVALPPTDIVSPPLEPAVPAASPPSPAPVARERPADLAPIYLDPESAEETRAPRPARAAAEPPVLPAVNARQSADPSVEYPGSFRREDTAGPTITPQARRLAEIDAWFANGDRDAALVALRSFVLANPAQEDAREKLALELIADGRVTEAEALLRVGLRLAPASTRLAQPLAHLLLAQNKPEAAIAALRPATPPVAGHTEFHALLAAAEQRVGAHGLAITRYRGLLKEQPLNGSWLVALGISLLAVDERADAAATFARALDDRALPEALRAYASRELVRLKDKLP